MIRSTLLANIVGIEHAFYGVSVEDREQAATYVHVADAEQIHGNAVGLVRTAQRYHGVDGLVTRTGVTLRIRTADCLPVLICDVNARIVSAIHAGWRGLQQEIIPRICDEIEKLGGSMQHCVMAIGPHIHSCCYHVSADMIDMFVSSGYERSDIERIVTGSQYLNLSEIAKQQAMKKGIHYSSIDISPICTYCAEGYMSYRKHPLSPERNMTCIRLV